MKQGRHNYHSYLLRLWRSSCDDSVIWHIMLENPHTGERHSFASIGDLIRFLQAIMTPSPPAGVDEGGDINVNTVGEQ